MGYIIFSALAGAWLFKSGTGFLIGLAIGIAYFSISQAFKKIEQLADAVAALEEKQAAEKKTVKDAPPEPSVPSPPPREQEKPCPLPMVIERTAAVPTMQAAASFQQHEHEPENFFTNLAKQLHKTSTVVRTGMVLLLFGLVFLFRYAAKNQEFTVETALMTTIGIGIILLFMGWRLAERKRTYALMLQGGSVAVLFTCLFLSTEVYALFPVFVSFAAMICLSVLAGLLAVRYDARETALIGMGGGFAAPLLSPVTSDQLIFLFSYYLLLAGGIFAVSRLRNWRVLHLLSCLFIIFVGLFIGQSEDVNHVCWQLEPFLLLFFLFYTLTEFLTVCERKDAWGDGMDFTLILAPPAACMFFQAVLSYPGFSYLFSITLALLAIYYGLAASWLQLQQAAAERLALLIRICIGLAFFSGNLLLLCAAGSVVSMLLYNAEAVICIWLAARKRQEMPIWFGMTLLLLPVLMVPFIDWLPLFRSQPLLVVSAGLSFCLSPFLCSVLLTKVPAAEKELAKNLLLWSLALWLIGGAAAISKTAPADWSSGLLLLFISLSFGMLRFGSQRLSWAFMDQLCNGLGILLSLIAAVQTHRTVFSGETLSKAAVCSSSLGWLISLAAYYGLLFLREKELAPFFRNWQHRLGGWLGGGIIVLQTCNAAKTLFHHQETWLSSAFGLAAGGWIVLLLLAGNKLRWPVRKQQLDYLGYGIIPFAAAAWIWTLNACLSLGDPSPLKYVPLLNPIETAQGICIAALFLWARELRQPALQILPLPSVVRNNMGIALHGTLFLCLTMMITRSICYYTHISFSAVGILSSPFLQTIISVIWSGTAFIIMLFSARAKRERENSLGTLLLFLVAAKLFLVDIHLSTELERICSFMWVGGIMLLAGYYLPAETESSGQ